MFYDSAFDAFRPTGYLRTVEVTTTASSVAPDRPHGTAQVIDRFPLEDFNIAMNDTGRFLRYARTGQVSDVTVLAVADNADPWPLLTDNLEVDQNRMAGNHDDMGGRVFLEPTFSLAPDCIDVMDPFDFETSESYNWTATPYSPCYSHGFTYPSSTSSWRGSAAPPASQNVETRSSITKVDDLGRPTGIFDEHDVHRSDDDICIDIQYAAPAMTGLRPPFVVASRTVSDCTKAGGTVHIYQTEASFYDGLPQGLVSEGLLTSHSTHSYTTDDNNGDQGTISEDLDYDTAANPILAHMHRTDGANTADRSTTLTYDEFGIAPTHVSVQGTGVPSLSVDNGIDPVTGEFLTSTDVNGTTTGTVFDGFGRELYETIEEPGQKFGVLKAWNYKKFDAPDTLGRRVEIEDFTDPVSLDDIATAVGRRATTYVDELGRPRFTDVELGDDYSNEVLVVGARSYDDLGRVVFQADPYATSQDAVTAYGTTRYFNQDGSPSVEIRGRGQQAYTTTVDESLEVYPTVISHGFDNYVETTVTMTPDSLVASSPQFGVQHQAVSTATGHVLSRATLQGGGRLEYEELAYDRLGQLASMTRYQDPATPASPVTTSWVHDSQGRVIKLYDPSSAAQTRYYDDWGELKSIEWTSPSEPTHDIEYTYDALGRLTHTEEHNDGVVDHDTVYDYGYDQGLTSPIAENRYTLGRLAYARGPSEEIRFGYDALGRTNARTYLANDGSVYVDQAGYHADGSQAWLELDLPDASYQPERMDYEYDTAGRLRWMWSSDGTNTEDVFDASSTDAWGRLREATFGLASYSASYANTGRRLAQSVKVTGVADSRSFDFGAADPVGRELTRGYSLPSFTGTETLGYNALGQLTSSKRVHGSATTSQWGFTYDPLGNATHLADLIGAAGATLSYMTTGDRDRICRIGYGNGGLGGSACNVDYDSLGNVIGEPTRTGKNALSYFNSGAVRSISNSDGISATFAYDPLGQLNVLDIQKGGVPLRQDRHYGDLITKRLQKSSGGIADYVLRQYPGPGMVISRRGSHGPWVYEFSEPKGVRFTVDETGKFVQDVDYAPFGEASSMGATPGTLMYSTDQWNGGDALDALGLVKVGARIYDPAIGRFLSRDPLIAPRTASTTNPYSFAANDPINLSDPTGMYLNGGGIWASSSDDSGELQDIAAFGAWVAELAFTWGASPAPMFNTKAQWTTFFGAYVSRSQELQANWEAYQFDQAFYKITPSGEGETQLGVAEGYVDGIWDTITSPVTLIRNRSAVAYSISHPGAFGSAVVDIVKGGVSTTINGNARERGHPAGMVLSMVTGPGFVGKMARGWADAAKAAEVAELGACRS